MSDTRLNRFAKVYNDTKKFPSLKDVAQELGISYSTVKNTAGMIRRRFTSGEPDIPALVPRSGKAALLHRYIDGDELEITTEVPSKDEPIEELVRRAIKYNKKVARNHIARDVIDIKVHTDGPIAVAGIPDPHLNNVGTNLEEAMRIADVISGEVGLYAVGIGDWLDNFIMGRLERERRKDIMSHSDAWRLQEHYVVTIARKLIAAIGGNHNDWIKSLGGLDVLESLFTELGLDRIYDPDQVRVRLQLPNGAEFTHLARHIFPGRSMYHPTHGILKWMLERWEGEDVLWGGHIHSAGHMSLTREWQGQSRVVRGIQLASYKEIDRYATSRGFRKCMPFQTPMVVHDPRDGSTTFFEDFDRGLEYLRAERADFAKAA